MSNAFAVAAVTAALKASLRSAVTTTAVSDALGGPPVVSALPPDRVNPAGAPDPNQLNLFLYAVSANPGWRNQNQPVRDATGMRIDNQPLALDLHYLLTAYGTTDYGAEILLGHGMQALHEVPFFTRSWLGSTLKSGPPPNDIPAALETTGLPEQIEQIRITPTTLSLDDMSRIWSAMQARYRPTATYLVTVVLIEAPRSRRTALPVQTRNIIVQPWTAIRIDDAVNVDETEMLTAGSTLRIRGSGLGASTAQVRVMDVDLSAGIARRSETEIDVVLPDPLPAGIRAGVVPVQLVQPAVGDVQFTSNAVGVTLHPTIAPDPTFAAKKITVTLSPRVTERQRVLLLLNERQPAAGQTGKAFSVAAPLRNGITGAATDTNKIVFPVPSIPAGTYVARIQVDGVQSPVEVDGSGRFDSPKVKVT